MKKIYVLLLMVGTTFCASAQDRLPLQPEQAKIRFYPNPATTIINFDFGRNIENTYTLQVYNFIGKKVTEILINNSKTTMSLDNFFRGVYIFQLRDKTGRITQSGKFQVVK